MLKIALTKTIELAFSFFSLSLCTFFTVLRADVLFSRIYVSVNRGIMLFKYNIVHTYETKAAMRQKLNTA